MSPSIQLAKRWLDIANRDLAAARSMQEDMPDLAAYHYQQCAEKSLKALFPIARKQPTKTHIVSTLILELAGEFPALLALCKGIDLDAVSRYATFYRYPNEEGEHAPPPDELDRIGEFCGALYGFATQAVTAQEQA